MKKWLYLSLMAASFSLPAAASNFKCEVVEDSDLSMVDLRAGAQLHYNVDCETGNVSEACRVSLKMGGDQTAVSFEGTWEPYFGRADLSAELPKGYPVPPKIFILNDGLVHKEVSANFWTWPEGVSFFLKVYNRATGADLATLACSEEGGAGKG